MPNHSKKSFKQHWLVGHLLMMGWLMTSLMATATEKVVVLTSYPQEMISHFEQAFEQAYPEYTLQVIWKQSNDALAFIKNNRHQVDVYWTPSRNNFKVLGQEGYFLKLDNSMTARNPVINGLPLNDPQGYYVATEIAGIGLVVNEAALKKLDLNLPTDWGDLANPSYQANIAFPIPSKIGFATGLLDAILQGKSWDAGWSNILSISANARLVDLGATLITENVANAKQAIGITMDFFAASPIAKGAALTYVYPPHVLYSPAHVALLNDAPNMAGAKAFLQFTLSEQGQTLLFDPDIRKLPVEQKVYAHQPAGYFNPYADTQHNSTPRSMAQLSVLNAIFDATITKHHESLVKLYRHYYQAKTMYPHDQRVTQIWALINSPIMSEQEANAAAVLQAFEKQRSDASADKQVQLYISKWSATALARFSQAEQLLNGVPPH